MLIVLIITVDNPAVKLELRQPLLTTRIAVAHSATSIHEVEKGEREQRWLPPRPRRQPRYHRPRRGR